MLLVTAACFRFITDNGAGGLSSSIGEMATQCGGARLELSNAPLKYVGLRPWEILLSEAQERMSFAVPPEDWDELKALADSYEVRDQQHRCVYRRWLVRHSLRGRANCPD